MREDVRKILDQVGTVIIGKEDTAGKLFAALLAEGHVLLEDVPGTGKTKLARALAASLDVNFGRIQFTPDMLPADITGLSIYNREKEQFIVKRGPVFTNVLLADEINRATPRTQSGLLECMEEKQVTIDGDTVKLEEPFFVIATQNPVENSGTFPLPEAQMDRFAMRLSMGMPGREEEIRILQTYMNSDPAKELQPIITADDLLRFRREAAAVKVHPLVCGYIADLCGATRNNDRILMGVSPRGALSLMRCAKAWAWMQGRDYMIPDDVKAMAVAVLSHRLVFAHGRTRRAEAESLVSGLLETVPVPVENFGTEVSL